MLKHLFAVVSLAAFAALAVPAMAAGGSPAERAPAIEASSVELEEIGVPPAEPLDCGSMINCSLPGATVELCCPVGRCWKSTDGKNSMCVPSGQLCPGNGSCN
jgi:hypothetical protein